MCNEPCFQLEAVGEKGMQFARLTLKNAETMFKLELLV